MARPFKRTYTPANASTTGFVNLGSGASLTLAATSAGDSLAHLVSITTVTDQSGKTFLITGTDENGIAQTETVTGPNSTIVYSSSYFLTISSIGPSATLGASTVSCGWKAAFVTPTYRFDNYARGVSCRVVVSGTITYTVQDTLSDIRVAASTALVWGDSVDAVIDLTAITASVDWGFLPIPIAMRLLASSYSNGAALTLMVNHQNQ